MNEEQIEQERIEYADEIRQLRQESEKLKAEKKELQAENIRLRQKLAKRIREGF